MTPCGSIRSRAWIAPGSCTRGSASAKCRATTTVRWPMRFILKRCCGPELRSSRGGRQIQRSAEIAGPGLRAPQQRYTDEAAHFEAVVIEQLDVAFVCAAAVRIVDRSARPIALAILVQALQYRWTEQYLLPAARVGIVSIDPMGIVAADDAALVAVVGGARDLNDAVARLARPAQRWEAGQHHTAPARPRRCALPLIVPS